MTITIENFIYMISITTIALGHEENPSAQCKNAFFSHCFEELHDAIYAMAYDHFNSKPDAKDLVASFFEDLMTWPISTFREKEDLARYILRAAYNHSMNELRTRTRIRNKWQHVELGHAAEVPDQRGTAEAAVIISETHSATMRAVNRLPKPQRDVILLKAEGLGHKEIAAKLGISVTTSTSRLNRARQKLHEILREDRRNRG